MLRNASCGGLIIYRPMESRLLYIADKADGLVIKFIT